VRLALVAPARRERRQRRAHRLRFIEYQARVGNIADSDKHRYPLQHFKAFAEAARRYAELTRADPLIHRNVVGAVNGLTDFLRVERKRVPEQVLWDAQRLECLLFSGYDPDFEGDEPPVASRRRQGRTFVAPTSHSNRRTK
jgi:hypothetical protein